MAKVKKIGILTSGGDTPGMNAAIQAAAQTAWLNGITPMGIYRGYCGLIDGQVDEIEREDVEGIVVKGGTILKTARCEAMRTEAGLEKAISVLKAFQIDGLIVIGGDGSMKGAKNINDRGIPTIGLPGTIDNDLAYTDYTIGFDTAINNVVGEITKIRDTMSSHARTGVIEVMGNTCGDIALRGGIAGGADYILVPESPFDIDLLAEKLIEKKIRGNRTSIIVVAEGAGKGEAIASYLSAKTHLDVKSIVLGYIQRGGSPSAFDRLIAVKMGMRAVELLKDGKAGRVVGIKNDKVMDMDITEALEIELKFDKKLYEYYHNMTDSIL